MQICSVQTTITWLIVHMCYAGMICATAAGEQAKYTMKKVSSGTENPKLIWVKKKHAFAFIQRVWCDNWLVSNAATQPWQWKRAVATANNNLFRCCCFFCFYFSSLFIRQLFLCRLLFNLILDFHVEKSADITQTARFFSLSCVKKRFMQYTYGP